MKITNSIKAKYILKLYKDLIKKNDKVLDIGSGNGYISKLIEEEYGVKMFGIDVIDHNKSDINFSIYNGRNIPFEDNYFDVTMFNTILPHIKTMYCCRILKEAKRVSKKILIFDMDKYKLKNILFYYPLTFLLDIIPHPEMEFGFNLRTRKQVIDLFNQSDLKVVQETYVKIPFWYPLTHIFFELKGR